jgi:ATP-binding cassette, subfamily B, bacterial
VRRYNFVVVDDGDDAPRPRRRTYYELFELDKPSGSIRELPGLVAASLKLVWGAGRREFLITASVQLLQAGGAAATLFVTRSLLGSAVRGRGGSFHAVVPALAVLVGLTLALELARAYQTEQSRVLSELVSRRALDRVLDVATRVDLLAYEDPDFYDRLQRAQMQGQMRALQTVQGFLGLIGGAAAAISIVGAMTALQPILLPVVLAGYVPLWIVSSRNTRDLYRFSFGMTPNDRERNYLQRVLLSRDPAKEVRAFNLAGFLRKRYDRLYDERIAELRSLARRRALRSLAASLGSSGALVIGAGVLAWLYVSGRLSIAAAGAAAVGVYQLTSRLQAMHLSASSLYEATLFVRDYRSFLGLEPETPTGARPAPRGFTELVVDDVTFTYPGAARPALDGISLRIAAGEVVALVGENGSGKTTLAKLLAGLYRPERGHVLWDGADVADVDPEQLREAVAVIFQDFERYRLPARDNVGLGRHARIDELQAILDAAERADAHRFLERLPEGYDTMLGREFFGGFDLSMGQWQRIALARAFFRDAPFVILDEPTAALDARAESNLFDRMRALLEGRSVVLISHRFSSVRSADRIYVLQRGRIVEHGSHEELMSLGGLYAELFTLQASAYLGERATR